MDLVELTRELAALPGISGDEGLVATYITECIKGHCDYKIDPLGNIIAHKKGAAPAGHTLMLSAHMDEVGLTVCRVCDDGTLKVHAVGGVDAAVVTGRRVLVGSKGLPGITGIVPIHLLEKEDAEKPLKLDSLYIDIGAADKAAAEKLAAPGDSVTFEPGWAELGDGMLMGKALDDRAGCALLVKLIQSDLPCDCVFAFTVQEEIGCIGGRTAAFAVRPEFSLVVETTTAGDLAGVPADKKVCSVGAGPVIPFMDRGAVYDAGMYRRARAVAGDNNIPCQTKEGVYGGTEARSVQQTAAGARVLAVSLPCRYLHSPSCLLARRDLEAEYKLLLALIGEFAG